jgi:L-fuculose-phosphate aldolase
MTDIQDIYQKFYTIGSAISRINANNTHSGNLSMRNPDDPDRFYITATGCQCGALVLRDIVPIHFSDVSWGDARGSTESTIHRKILKIPGVNAVLHAHYIYGSTISFDSKETQLFLQYLGTDDKGREEFLFHPVDLFGAYIVGGIKVGSYEQPVGSPEMEERLPFYLEKNRLTIVRGHGPFARGTSLDDCFYRLSVLEQSALLVLNLRRRGVNAVKIQKEITDQGKEHFFQTRPHLLNEAELSHCEIEDQSVLTDFKQRLNYNYNNKIGAYGTGSMSQKVTANEMIFCPMASVPEGMAFPLYRMRIDFQDTDSIDLRMHKLIYQNTHQNTCMITTSPLATSEGMAVLAEHYGMEVLLGKNTEILYTPENHPVVSPIDAEAIYLNPRLGLVDFSQLLNHTSDNPILNMLRWYKGCCIVAGYGVISTGDTTLEQAAHNAASAERISQFRSDVFINEKLLHGPPMNSFENKTI